MWHGIYDRWEPLTDWSGCRVDIEAVHDDWDGFRIWIRHDDASKGMLIARFSRALFHCTSDEGDRISPLSPAQPALEFPHVFWTVTDSELLALFHRHSCDVHADRELVHYSFLSCNDCVDVLSSSPPRLILGYDEESSG